MCSSDLTFNKVKRPHGHTYRGWKVVILLAGGLQEAETQLDMFLVPRPPIGVAIGALINSVDLSRGQVKGVTLLLKSGQASRLQRRRPQEDALNLVEGQGAQLDIGVGGVHQVAEEKRFVIRHISAGKPRGRLS